MTLQPINRERLDKLATYLESLPKSYKHFGMSEYIDALGIGAEKSVKDYALTNGGVASCGTAACAVGHGPAAGIYVPEHLVIGDSVNWNGYALLFTGAERTLEPLWYWMFGGAWDSVDNHHWGAAARIRYVLADKPIPGDCDAPRRGHRQLYREFDKRYAS